jgi:hypothetical protein
VRPEFFALRFGNEEESAAGNAYGHLLPFGAAKRA